MTIREYVAGQLIRLARKLDPHCAVDWTQLREQELLPKTIPVVTKHAACHDDGTGLCYWCFEKATGDLYGVPLCDRHAEAELWKEGQQCASSAFDGHCWPTMGNRKPTKKDNDESR